MSRFTISVGRKFLAIATAVCVLASASISLFGQSPTTLAIHDIQGSGNSSPFVRQIVTTTGIVTGLRSNGFFLQTPDGNVDNDPSTSEGILVFTSTAPPLIARIGNAVTVTGTVTEFRPSSDAYSPTETEMTAPSVNLVSTGNPLPTPVTLTAADTSPSGSIEQLEKYEGMRVRADSLTVISPTQGSINETNATSTTNGVFYAVVTGVARPFREPGIQLPDPVPSPAPCCIPRFDANPERLRVDSDAQPGAVALEVTSGAMINNILGVLDYGARTYTILPDAASPPTVSNIKSATAVPAPKVDELTIGSFNMERFFDTTADPNTSDVVLTNTAFNHRLTKASLAIRNIMRSPDIIGIEEMENLATLQAVASKINDDEVAISGSNPRYQAYLVEGNDPGGIDVGFLVKSSRVSVVGVSQEGKNATYINPNTGAADLLNDRPPLILRATVAQPDSSASLPFTVIVNHLRSLSSISDAADGNRVRAKRRAQAEFLAKLVQSRQVADPDENIVAIGDYNAFQFNDGYVDVIGTIKGTPTPASQVLLASADLVNPDLVNLVDEIAADQRYSYSFDGNAQVLDHILVNRTMRARFNRLAYARNNSDFPETYRNDATRPERISDHDMPVAYFTLSALLPPSTVQFSAVSYQASENDRNAIVTVTRSGDITGEATVEYTTIDDPAPVRCNIANGTAYARCDYSTTVDSLKFAAGETQKSFSIPLIDDAYVERDEAVQLALSNPMDTTLGAQSTATLIIHDNDVGEAPNPILDTPFFVRMQYLDFLSREPEADGINAWVNLLNRCAPQDTACDRLEVSSSFFRSQEFQIKGLFVYTFYRVSFGRLPKYVEIIPDMRRVTGATGDEVRQKRKAFTGAWVQRSIFSDMYGHLSDDDYVDTLLRPYALTAITTEDPFDSQVRATLTRDSLVGDLRARPPRRTRAEVLRLIVQSDEVYVKEFNRAFVAMQYFGYLRRDPEPEGYEAWLRVLTRGENYRIMVNGFVNSTEYQSRFGQPRN